MIRGSGLFHQFFKKKKKKNKRKKGSSFQGNPAPDQAPALERF